MPAAPSPRQASVASWFDTEPAQALRELERRWDGEVYSVYQERLASRYPINPAGPDASLKDFEAFFGPQGQLKRFEDQYLTVFLKDNLDALLVELAALYPVDVAVEAADRQGLLRDISDVFTKERMNVIGVQTQSVRGVAWMTFTIEVTDARQVARAMSVVGDVPGVRVVRRK